MSFSRPDPSSPASVADAVFGTGRRGFDQAEVRDFLRMVAAELGRLQERERFLERELRSAQSSPDLSSARLDDEALTRLLGEETARVLQTARESANQIKEKAEGAAGRMLAEASDEARRLREEAEVESARRRADAASDAEAELDMAKQQGREMVNEARAYRERVLSELARRRELAREQIEQLIHGRDRLMQSFERARLVAVDIVSEMQPLGEPDEYVNLEPTTGPVPVMVVNAARPDDTASHDAAPGEQPAGAEPDADAADNADADAPGGGGLTVVEDEEDGDAATDETAGRGAEIDDAKIADVEAAEAEAGDVEAGEVEAGDAEATEVEAGDAEATEVEAGEVEAGEVEAGEVEAGEVEAGEAVAADDEPDAEAGVDVPPETAETSDADDSADSAVSVESDESATTDESIESDDVVVDLFARLRADAAPADSDEPTGDGDVADHDPAQIESVGDSIWGHADDVVVESTGDAIAESAVDPAELPEPTRFERRDEDLTPLIVSSARKLKRVLADEQNGVLDALRRHHPVRDIDDLLPAADEHAARYGDAIADDLLLAAQAGADSVATGRAAKLSKSAAGDATSAAGGVLDEWLVAPLRDRLQRCVSEGDGDNDVITKKVRAAYREWKTRHIDEQLDDVLLAAHGRGVLAALPAGSPVTWGVDDRHGACADCDDNALGGEVPAGDEFPTGDTFAPAHPGCRCMLLPVAR